MAKAANFNSVVATHKAQVIKLSNNLLVFWLLLLMFSCSRKINMRIKWAGKFQQCNSFQFSIIYNNKKNAH